MPELPEVETAVLQLRENILGATVRELWVGRSDIIREGYQSLPWYRASRIEAVERRGKSVIFSFSRAGGTRFLAAELGMTGLLLFRSAPTRYPQHTHFVMHLAESREPELRYWNPRRFGRLYLLDASGLERYLRRRFGYEPLTMTRQEFATLMASCRGRLKALLMHQQKIAGIGNIYANEILFRAGLHPRQVAYRVKPDVIDRLYDVIRDVLLEAVEFGGSSVRDFFAPDGTLGTYKSFHRVYGKTGAPCPNQCGATVRRVVEERSSFICPVCQPRSGRRREIVP